MTGARRGTVRGGALRAVVGGAVGWRGVVVVGLAVTGRAAVALVAEVVGVVALGADVLEATGAVAATDALIDADRVPDAVRPAKSA